jgi:hypothetical protein
MTTTDQIVAKAEQQIEAIISMRWGETWHGDVHEAVRQVIKAAIEKATEWLQRDLKHLGEVVAEMQKERDRAAQASDDTKRLEWLLPRQYDHRTRESIDAELGQESRAAQASEQDKVVDKISIGTAIAKSRAAQASESKQSEDDLKEWLRRHPALGET